MGNLLECFLTNESGAEESHPCHRGKSLPNLSEYVTGRVVNESKCHSLVVLIEEKYTSYYAADVPHNPDSRMDANSNIDRSLESTHNCTCSNW